MKKQRIWWILALACFVLQILSECMLGLGINRLNILPDNIWWLLVGAFCLLAVGVGLLGLFHLPGKTVGVTRRCIACVLSLLIAVLCFIGWHAVELVHSTMNEITITEPNVPSRAVFVRTDDPATTLEDTKDYPYGVTTDYDAENCLNVRQSIEFRLQTTLNTTEFATATPMVDALLNDQVDAIILNSGYLSVLEEQEEYKDILTKIRLVEQIPLVERQEPDVTEAPTTVPTTEPTTEPAVVENITNTPFVVYFSGLDVRGTSLFVSRSDVNILAVINPVTKQILLVNTPRDYFIPHPHSQSGTKDKLTHLGIYGMDCSIAGLEALYDVQVDYNAQINFSGFEKLIDAIGGITIYSDRSFTAYEERYGSFTPVYIQKGDNQLGGAEALAYARDRYNQPGGDNDRGKNQMKVIKAVIQKATSGTTIISNYAAILESVSGMFTTSMTMDDISLLVKMQLTDMSGWNVLSYAVTGTGGSAKTYSMPDLSTYVTYPDEDSVAFGAQLIKRVIDGEILTEEDVKYS